MASLFLVHFAVGLGLKALAAAYPAVGWLFTGILGNVWEYFGSRFLGFLVQRGILVIDLGASAIKIGLEEKDYKAAIEKAYKNAIARVYTEEEKVAIRKQYLDALRPFASVGDGLRK